MSCTAQPVSDIDNECHAQRSEGHQAPAAVKGLQNMRLLPDYLCPHVAAGSEEQSQLRANDHDGDGDGGTDGHTSGSGSGYDGDRR
eukprot:1159985-Pelagomonas_calceolata.AAC.5